MKTFKRLMSFALALLMLASVIPTSVISARAAPSNAEMMDNFVLDSMAYLEYNMDGFKKSGLMYHNYGNEIGEEGVNYAPAKIKYVADGTAANGTETTKDTTTVTGKAPYKTSFEYSGMCCGSFVAYYTMNYLYNIKGEDVKDYIDAMNTYKDGSYKSAQCWRVTLERVFANRKDVLDRIYYAEYDAKENEKPKRPSDDDYNKWAVGDIITFGFGDESGKEHYSHVAIYLGAKNGLHWVAHSVPNRTNSDGKNVSIVFGTVEMMYNASNGKTASIVTGVYRILKADHYEKTGKIEVYKEDPNGKKLDGAYFLATHQESNKNYTIGPTVNGYASKDQLPYGTYKVVETTFPAGYTYSGTKEWTETLNESTPNRTITINAENKLITGTGKITKKSTNGGTVEGWWFYTWQVVNGTWKWAGRFKTGADGTFSHDFVPGTYIVREVPLSAYEQEGLSLPNGVDPQYWTQVTADKTLTITANETSYLTFDNEYYGKIQIQKSTNTGSDLAGWVFEVKDSGGKVVATLTTNSKGTATSAGLPQAKRPAPSPSRPLHNIKDQPMLTRQAATLFSPPKILLFFHFTP